MEDSKSEYACMHRLINIVSFESKINEEDKELAKNANLKLITYDEVL